MREARYVSLIPRTTLHSDSEQYFVYYLGSDYDMHIYFFRFRPSTILGKANGRMFTSSIPLQVSTKQTTGRTIVYTLKILCFLPQKCAIS